MPLSIALGLYVFVSLQKPTLFFNMILFFYQQLKSEVAAVLMLLRRMYVFVLLQEKLTLRFYMTLFFYQLKSEVAAVLMLLKG